MKKLNILLVSPTYNSNCNFMNVVNESFVLGKQYDADLIVFPEGMDYAPNEKDLIIEKLLKEYPSFSIPILMGIFVGDEIKKNTSQWAYYYNPKPKQGETKFKTYCKHSTAQKLAYEMNNYSELQKDFFSPIILNGYKIQVNICHDAFFPLITEKMERNGMDILINLTGGNVVMPKWHNVFRGRSIESGKTVFCAMGHNSNENGKSDGFGFKNGEKMLPNMERYSANSDQFHLFKMDEIQLDNAFISSGKTISPTKNDDFHIGFNAIEVVNGFNLFLQKRTLFCKDNVNSVGLEILEKWHTHPKKKNVKIIGFNYQCLFDRANLQKSSLWKEEEANYFVVYYSEKNVDIDKTISLLKLRAIENKVTAICFAPNYKAVIKTNNYKNIQFIESKDGGIVGLDLRYMGGFLSVFGKAKGRGIPLNMVDKYLELVD